MPFFVPKGYIIGFVIEGEIIKGKGIFNDSVKIISPPDIKQRWSSLNTDLLIELKQYPGKAQSEIQINELLKLIHLYASKPSDDYLRTLVYINNCNILEYLHFSQRELPDPPQFNSLYRTKQEALNAMNHDQHDLKIECNF